MVTLESKTVYTCPAHAPSIQSCGVCCFLQVARTAAQHNSMEKGWGGGCLLLGILGGVVLPSSPNPDHIFGPKNVTSHTRF